MQTESASFKLIETVLPELATRAVRYDVDADPVDDDIAAAFREETGLMIPKFHAALAANDFDAIRRAAHSLKGMGGACGAPEISALGEALETAAKAADAAACRTFAQTLERWQNLTP